MQEPVSFAGHRFDGLTSLPVTAEGGWSPGRKRDWQGIAISSEPLVAVAFLRVAGVTEWCKSERHNENGLELRLALFPYDESLTDVQVNFSVGGGRCLSRIKITSRYNPPVMDRR